MEAEFLSYDGNPFGVFGSVCRFPVLSLHRRDLQGLQGAVTIFWVTVFWLLSSQYYFPSVFQLGGGAIKNLKKSFIIFLDNTGFTFFLGIHTLVLIVVSFPAAFLIPGISVILLSHQTALKLRMYKYDYLEKHPGAKGKGYPLGKVLLMGETGASLGSQGSLKGTISPGRE